MPVNMQIANFPGKKSTHVKLSSGTNSSSTQILFTHLFGFFLFLVNLHWNSRMHYLSEFFSMLTDHEHEVIKSAIMGGASCSPLRTRSSKLRSCIYIICSGDEPMSTWSTHRLTQISIPPSFPIFLSKATQQPAATIHKSCARRYLANSK